jgi:hypothetical protein
MIENINELAKFVKGGADVLQNALKSEENISLEFIEGSFVSDSDLNGLKESRFNEGKKEGQTIGYDFAMKDLKKDFSIELEGKDRSKIVSAIQEKIITDAKIEPNKKVDELNTSLANLQTKYENDLGVKSNEISNLSKQLNDLTINSDLNKHLPDGLNGIDNNDFMTIAKTSASFEYDEGVLVVKKNGTVLRDKMEKPIAPKDYLTEFATNKQWIKSDGRSGGDQQGQSNGFENINEVYGHMEKNKIDPLSAAGQKLVADFNKLNS